MTKKIIHQKGLKEQEKLILLFCLVDDFLKQLSNFRIRIEGKKKGRRVTLSLSEIITLGIFRIIVNIGNVKDYHKFLLSHYYSYFKIPAYANFNNSLNRAMPYVIMLLHVFTQMVKKKKSNLHFIDSTALPVCKNKRISSHKVAKGLAELGKTTIGWFYGFKLHIICNTFGELESITVTPGNVYDGHTVSKLAKDIFGQIIADAGYLGAKSTDKYKLMIAVRKNMKKLMTFMQHTTLKGRQLVESVFSVIKERLNIVTSLARSIDGLFSRYAFCLLAYFFIELRH